MSTPKAAVRSSNSSGLGVYERWAHLSVFFGSLLVSQLHTTPWVEFGSTLATRYVLISFWTDKPHNMGSPPKGYGKINKQ